MVVDAAGWRFDEFLDHAVGGARREAPEIADIKGAAGGTRVEGDGDAVLQDQRRVGGGDGDRAAGCAEIAPGLQLAVQLVDGARLVPADNAGVAGGSVRPVPVVTGKLGGDAPAVEVVGTVEVSVMVLAETLTLSIWQRIPAMPHSSVQSSRISIQSPGEKPST